MKRFGWLALLMAGNLYGCVTPVAVQPKYKLAVSKETAAPNDFCSLKFDLTNSRASLANPWIEAVVLDAENKIIVDKFVTFVASAPGTIYQEETISTRVATVLGKLRSPEMVRLSNQILLFGRNDIRSDG